MGNAIGDAAYLECSLKTVTQVSDKNCGKIQELEPFVEPSETKTILEGQKSQSSVMRARIEQKTAAIAVYNALLDWIIKCKLVPGQRLQEKSFMNHFHLSRTPIREAFMRLAHDGLVDILPQSGTFVAPIPLVLIPELVVIRQALEQATVEAAARHTLPQDIDRLDELIDQQRFFAEKNMFDEFYQSDEKFHEHIAQIARYPGIWRHLRSCKIQIDRIRHMGLPILGSYEKIISQHITIRDALATHQPQAAQQAMYVHLNAVLSDMEKVREIYPTYFC